MPKRQLPAHSNKPLKPPKSKKDGLIIRYGSNSVYVDFLEVLLWILLSIPVAITVKDFYVGSLNFEESIKRVGIIGSVGFFIRGSPTEAIYSKVFGIRFDSEEHGNGSEDDQD